MELIIIPAALLIVFAVWVYPTGPKISEETKDEIHRQREILASADKQATIRIVLVDETTPALNKIKPLYSARLQFTEDLHRVT